MSVEVVVVGMVLFGVQVKAGEGCCVQVEDPPKLSVVEEAWVVLK